MEPSSNAPQQQQQQQPQTVPAITTTTTAPNAAANAAVSVTKTLTRLLAIPANRSCADCKSALVDSSQVHASYSPNISTTAAITAAAASVRSPRRAAHAALNHHHHHQQQHNYSNFERNHAAFAPPSSESSGDPCRSRSSVLLAAQQQRRQPPSLRDLPVDPAIAAASQNMVGHGVFVCALCGAAHKLLSTGGNGNNNNNNTTVAITKAVMDVSSWTADDVQWLASAGGNARATAVLEAYYNDRAAAAAGGLHRPTAASSIADRLTFIRAKYEALAFCLPPCTGPLAAQAWEKIVDQHPEWKGLWGVDDLRSLSGLELGHAIVRDDDGGGDLSKVVMGEANRKCAAAELPNRLVDYFCVVTASNNLHPAALHQDLSTAISPEDFLLAPRVSDCFPAADSYNQSDDNCTHEGNGSDNNNRSSCSAFPEHVSTFVFPDGCRASSTALPPSFFTFVLTNATGERLYGGALRLYDDDRDTVETLSTMLTNSDYPASHWPSWLLPPAQQPPTKISKAKGANRSSSLPNRGQTSSQTTATTTMVTPERPKVLSGRKSSLPTMGNVTAAASDVMFLPKCLVVLSHYPFFDLWRKFLLQIYRIALTEAPLPIERFVANFVCEVPLPPPGKVQVKFGFTIKDNWTIERPPENQLPLANFSYQPLFACLSVSNVLVVMGCLLQETRVALVSKHYALLGPVAEALLSLLFPFHWQGMYLPIMPYNMLEILDAPVPYLVGLHSRYLTEVPVERRPEGVVLVDLDRDEVHLGFCDDSEYARSVPALPERHAIKLKAKLLEFAACAYIMPNTQRAGYITTGFAEEFPQSERDVYAQISSNEVPTNSTARRRDIFPHTDKAFRDNELLVPISGFLSEHGHLYQRETSNDSKEKKAKFQFNINRSKKNGSVFDGTRMPSPLNHPHDNENLLELKEPPGFSASEIRDAFLRFFTSLFQTYRAYLDGTEFRSSDFLASLNLSIGSSEFVKALTETQMFHGFTEERGESPHDPEVLFFDHSINAKINRSKKVTLTGRKKETSFLNDNRSMITETFTPPPPSNFGLPDDGRSYQYGTFPELDHDLFGKIRRPMKWREQNLRASLRHVGRRSSTLALANEQAVVEKATRSMLTIVTKRGVRNLETALKALSTPFVATPRRSATGPGSGGRDGRTPSRERSVHSFLSDLSLPSTLDMTPEVVSSAEEVVLNARRKRAILVGIIVKFQAYCRMYLKRNRRHSLLQNCHDTSGRTGNDELKIRRVAAVVIQCWVRAFLARRRFTMIRLAVVTLQANRRRLFVRAAYHMLLTDISKAQAVSRGHLIRRCLSALISRRMKTYKKQIFLLWSRADTPLSYRSKFWPHLNSASFVRMAVAELELTRLWKELKIQPPNYSHNSANMQDEGLRLGALLGVSNNINWKTLEIEKMLAAQAVTSRKGKQYGGVHGGAAGRVLAERTQIYERLSLSSHGSAERIRSIFARFSIPLKEKKKKAALTESVWSKYDEADQSAELMSEIFPELLESTDVYFVTPSKKALRRFPTSDPIPPPLDRTMQAHRFLDDRIHRDVAEVADFALRTVPSLTIVLETGSKSLHNAPSPRLLVAVMSSRGISNESAVRFLMIRQMLFKGTQHQPPSMEAFGEANSNEVVRGENGAKSNNGESLPGSNFWEAPETTFYPDLLAPPQQRDSHQSLATGTTPMRPFGYDSSRGLELSAFSCDSR